MTDKLSTEAIMGIIDHSSVDFALRVQARTELAAILKRVEEQGELVEALEDQLAKLYTVRANENEAKDKRVEEQKSQIAVMREAIVDVTTDCAGESFAEKLELAESNVRDVGLTKTADYLAELTSALYRAESALTPDTGKRVRVVDVAWLKEIRRLADLDAITSRSIEGPCASQCETMSTELLSESCEYVEHMGIVRGRLVVIHDKLAALIGEETGY